MNCNKLILLYRRYIKSGIFFLPTAAAHDDSSQLEAKYVAVSKVIKLVMCECVNTHTCENDSRLAPNAGTVSSVSYTWRSSLTV